MHFSNLWHYKHDSCISYSGDERLLSPQVPMDRLTDATLLICAISLWPENIKSNIKRLSLSSIDIVPSELNFSHICHMEHRRLALLAVVFYIFIKKIKISALSLNKKSSFCFLFHWKCLFSSICFLCLLVVAIRKCTSWQTLWSSRTLRFRGLSTWNENCHKVQRLHCQHIWTKLIVSSAKQCSTFKNWYFLSRNLSPQRCIDAMFMSLLMLNKTIRCCCVKSCLVLTRFCSEHCKRLLLGSTALRPL